MKVEVATNLCIDCALCQSLCPAVFGMDFDRRATAITGEVPKKYEKVVKQAEIECPVGAISILK
ncbi:ferredoxin [Clostridium tarantellae]|uniref:Ferredoxin n=1 Tax=Clostridium tarantellae TaxID=39493 RepID=A0A6I1MLN3_9CLOT|nr:ferredoxin [Clostridium tarantellae]MPQ44325.1 ferredoxin [Clostridium tarantellae]